MIRCYLIFVHEISPLRIRIEASSAVIALHVSRKAACIISGLEYGNGIPDSERAANSSQ